MSCDQGEPSYMHGSAISLEWLDSYSAHLSVTACTPAKSSRDMKSVFEQTLWKSLEESQSLYYSKECQTHGRRVHHYPCISSMKVNIDPIIGTLLAPVVLPSSACLMQLSDLECGLVQYSPVLLRQPSTLGTVAECSESRFFSGPAT